MKKYRVLLPACLLLVLGMACAVMAAGELHGNTKSRIYHNSSCRYYTCRNCTVIFASAQEARAAGFRPCRICGGEPRQALPDRAARPCRRHISGKRGALPTPCRHPLA